MAGPGRAWARQTPDAYPEAPIILRPPGGPLTEIPEHLLQRSRERRAAMGGGDAGAAEDEGDSGEAGASAAPTQAAQSAPAPSMPAHPEPAEEPPPPPPSPMVEAYQRRRRIPFWALPVLAALPLWAYVYAGTLDPPPEEGGGVAELGAELYAGQGCGGCHGASGDGSGPGPAFAGGAIYETWPDYADHFEWVRLGSAGWQEEHGDTYGATDKPVGGGMPGYAAGSLSDADLAAIILHERADLGGTAPDAAQLAQLEEIATLLQEDPDLTFEEAMAEVGGAEQAAG